MGTPAFEPERVLAGRYRLERRLGQGGMGTIWVAEHLVLQAPVAVKLIDRDAVPDDETSARFLREAKAAATLRSPHVVQILDYGMDEGVPFIVMELLDGETLSQRIRRTSRLGAAETVRIITHIGRAIGRAHEAGIVHRDLKPDNVFLVRNEDDEIAKVLDFGVAKIAHGELKEGTRTRTGSILGTPFYMSPEQTQGNKAVDYRSDLWSLGVIAFECLTGTRPFFSDGLGDLVLQICVRDLPVPSAFASVPLGFDEWFAKSVAREPELRFQSAREMTDALREALGIDPREAYPGLPEVVVSTSSDEKRVPPSSLETDPNAPTVALEPEEVLRLAQSGVDESTSQLDEEEPESQPRGWRESGAPRPSPISSRPPNRMDSRRPSQALQAAPHSSGTSLSTVMAVAAAALALGMAGGLVALWQVRGSPEGTFFSQFVKASTKDPSVNPELPLQAVPGDLETPANSVVESPARPVPSSSTAATSAAVPAPSAAPDALIGEPRPTSSGSPDRVRQPEPPPDAGVLSPQTPDAGWTKPAWAVPDEEPRKAPDLMQGEDP